jgi:hypothetical protein
MQTGIKGGKGKTIIGEAGEKGCSYSMLLFWKVKQKRSCIWDRQGYRLKQPALARDQTSGGPW